MAPKIFISYRRQDAQAAAGRVYDHLSAKLARSNVFMDVDSIEPGADFVALLEERMSQCEVLIAVIGPTWISVTDREGNRRLAGAGDFVRLEIEGALKRNIRIVPVLVDGAQMPDTANLPETLKPLSRLHAFEVSHHRFHDDMRVLSEFLSKTLGLDLTGPQGDAGPQGETGPQSAPAMRAPDSTPSWTSALLSFRGRMSRKHYWIWAVVLTLVSILLQYLALVLAGEPAGKFLTDSHAISARGKLLMQLCVLPIWWMAFAVIAKRIHDFGHGWGVMTFVVVLSVVFLIFDLLVGETLKTLPSPETDPTAMGIQVLHFSLSVFFLIAFATIGLIKGQTGPNKYGADPKAVAS